MLLPITKMKQRLDIDRQDSDVTTFYTLLFFGEMITKLTVTGIIAGIQSDKDRQRYRLEHRLVHADGVGDWAQSLEEALTGPASHFLLTEVHKEQRELTQRNGLGTWQYDVVSAMHRCLIDLKIEVDQLSHKVPLKLWFNYFAILRNKTRGHGAPTSEDCMITCSALEKSIDTICTNFILFKRPWAYLHRNYSGKYRVTSFGSESDNFVILKKDGNHSLENGVYIDFGGLVRANLMISDSDASDFLFANGGFHDEKYDVLSYITNEKRTVSALTYMSPVQQLPQSETHSLKKLDATGNCFSNLPPLPRDYIRRTDLEQRLLKQLQFENHPLITLTGSGGIGKTTLALHVIYELTTKLPSRFDVVLWFSARDIDLLREGPKQVRPDALSLSDFANAFVSLIEPVESDEKDFNRIDYFSQSLTSSPVGPTLFVFDNFETVTNPKDVFLAIDTFIRAPNKALITTRVREFKGDYPLEVAGMNESESFSLLESTAAKLGIRSLIDENYMKNVYEESSGHPYVMKILLGEIAKAGRQSKPERIIANQDEILTALFERTFVKLSPAAVRIFLLLCNWRSVVPQIAVEVALLRSDEERIDVQKAIVELVQASFLEEIPSPEDNQIFLNVPLAAMVYGKKKIAAHPLKAAIEADTKFLYGFGPGRKEDIRKGALPRIMQMMKNLAQDISSGKGTLESFRPTLEFIARKVPETWMEIAKLYSEQSSIESMNYAKECIRRFIENRSNHPNVPWAWGELADYNRRTKDVDGEIHALVEMCKANKSDLKAISSAVNRVNGIMYEQKLQGPLSIEIAERRTLIAQLAEIFNRWNSSFDGDDCSRLAWMYLNLGEEKLAIEVVKKGFLIDPNNSHCIRLMSKLDWPG